MQDGGHQLTWRQTSKYSIASGCGNYRVAKCKGREGWLYLPYAKINDKWELISKALDSADEAKSEVEQWSQHKKK